FYAIGELALPSGHATAGGNPPETPLCPVVASQDSPTGTGNDPALGARGPKNIVTGDHRSLSRERLRRTTSRGAPSPSKTPRPSSSEHRGHGAPIACGHAGSLDESVDGSSLSPSRARSAEAIADGCFAAMRLATGSYIQRRGP